MSNTTSSLSSLLKDKREKEEEEELQKLQASKPEVMPTVGSIILFYYGDPVLINSPVVELPAVVTGVDEWGRINGWAWVDPGATAVGPDGRPVRVPPMIPLGQVAYSDSGQKLTWRWQTTSEEII